MRCMYFPACFKDFVLGGFLIANVWFFLPFFLYFPLFSIFKHLSVIASISTDSPTHNLDKLYKRSDNNIISLLRNIYSFHKINLLSFIDENLNFGCILESFFKLPLKSNIKLKHAI